MIIDTDAHYTPPPWIFDHVDIQEWYHQYLDKKQNNYTDITKRLQELKTLKVDHQILNFMGISLNMNYRLSKSVGRRVMQIYNQHMHEIIDQHSCFGANIWLALQDLESSLIELELRANQNYFAVFLSDAPHWGFMPEYDVLFDKIAQHKIPVYLHQTEIDDIIESDSDSWSEQLGKLKEIWPRQDFWKITIASLIIGGILDRYPELKIIVAERGTNWINEFESTVSSLGVKDFRKYLYKNFWFTTEPEMPDFLEDAESLGWDRMLFATDWPHDRDAGGSNSLNDVTTVESLPISDRQKNMLYYKNYLYLRN